MKINNIIYKNPLFVFALEKEAGTEFPQENVCHVLKKVYTFYINTKIRLQFKYNPKIDLQSPFFCNNFSIYNLPF